MVNIKDFVKQVINKELDIKPKPTPIQPLEKISLRKKSSVTGKYYLQYRCLHNKTVGHCRLCNFKAYIRKKVNDRMSKAFKRFNISGNIKYLGCSIEQFIEYIESKWTDGMNWSNYGLGINKWAFDHILPTGEEGIDVEECIKRMYYKNTQPMWFRDNIDKSNKNDTKKVMEGVKVDFILPKYDYKKKRLPETPYIECTLCHKQIRTRGFLSHSKICTNKSVVCQFCNLSIPINFLKCHQKSCMINPHLACDICGKSITPKYLHQHKQRCHSNN